MNSNGKDWTIVGVDCATKPARLGLARGLLRHDGRLSVSRVTPGSAGDSPASTIACWINGCEHFVIAMDAPLGWPAALAGALLEHRVTQPIPHEADDLFHRATDDYVYRKLKMKRRPLEVGANLIARTAKSALSLLQEVREKSIRPIPSVWTPGEESGVIEVYPAATLLSRDICTTGYTKPVAEDKRKRILERLREEIDTETVPSGKVERITKTADLLDGVVCVLAGADFVRGAAYPPKDLVKAEREGWIWFCGRGTPNPTDQRR